MVQPRTKAAPLAWVDSGVDYLTCTYNVQTRVTRLRHHIAKVQDDEHKQGNMVHDWSMAGYMGFRCGGLEYGWRHDGLIIRLSGPTAQAWWKRFGKLASNCSRIDLQQTALWDEDVPQTLRRHWKEMLAWSKLRERSPALKLILGADGPETIYSGKRQSDVYLRAYNRFAKTKEERFMGHLRYEVEFKSARAKFVLDQMVHSDDQHRECASRCLQMFNARGCRLPPPSGIPAPFRWEPRTTEVSKRLRWLETAVKGTVQELIALGYGQAVGQALGICNEDGTIGPLGPER